jgi:hypothetical protein
MELIGVSTLCNYDKEKTDIDSNTAKIASELATTTANTSCSPSFQNSRDQWLLSVLISDG